MSSVETAVPSRNLPAVWQEGASRAGGEAGAFSRGKEGRRGLGHQTLRVTEAVRVCFVPSQGRANRPSEVESAS